MAFLLRAILVAILLGSTVAAADEVLPRELDLEQQILDLQRQTIVLEQRVAKAESAAAQMVQVLVEERATVRLAGVAMAQAALDQKVVTALGGDWAAGDRWDATTKTITKGEPKPQ